MRTNVLHRPLAIVTTTVLGLLASAGGCSCDPEPGLDESRPILTVTPNPVAFGTVPVLQETAIDVRLENTGTQTLVVGESPVLSEDAGDGIDELVLRAVLRPVTCSDGSERSDDDPTSLQPGECATITIVYRPQNLGPDTGTLTIESNDPKAKSLAIPITGEGSAPDIEVCLLAGPCVSEEVCATPEQPLIALDFPQTEVGQSVTCPVRISNTGALALERLAWGFKSGNRRGDYTLDPDPLSAVGSLATGEGIEGSLTFAPKSGGPKEAVVEITSTDPDEAAVTLEITGMGDGPKLCPDPFPVVDFGQVEIGQTKAIDVDLSDCGTKDLSITRLEVQDAAGNGPSAEFALGAGSPSAPPDIPLTPGASTTVSVEFTPPALGSFAGRLYLETTDPVVPSGWVTLVGEGAAPAACVLQPSTLNLAFGPTVPSSAGGTPTEKTLALSNAGKLPCTGVDAAVTAGDTVRFSISGLPPGGTPLDLAPGDIALFTIAYDPADVTGPDEGVVSFTANELSAPIDVQLSGIPVETPSCKLEVLPVGGNFQLGFCSIMGGFNPRVVNFGASPMGQKKTLPITLENIGPVACTISKTTVQTFNPSNPFGGSSPALTIDAPADQVLVGGTPTQTIQPGEVGVIPVTFLPLNEEEACGSVEVETSETTFAGECLDLTTGQTKPGCYRISIVGSGVRPLLQVVPTELDFGVITLGCASRASEVTIHNTGQSTINLTALSIDPAGSPFAITSAPPLPYAIPAGGNVKVGVTYRPPDANPHAANLIIESDDATSPLVSVPLRGEGTTDAHQVDVFQQLSEPMVDVLWIVDNSCSMGDEQQNLADNAQTFLSQALSLQTDFHLGVVTTDMEDPADSGLLQQGNAFAPAPKWVDRSTPDPATAFGNSVKQGTMGDATEKGLQAAYAALTHPLITDPALNGGFLREDARLVMIVISDEEDSSPSTVDFYVDAFKNIKGYRRPDLMSFSSVVGPEPNGCSNSYGAASAGTRYLEVTRRTGGLERSICTNDWGQLAADLGLDAFGAKTDYYLTREAIPSTIQVRVDGTPVPQSGKWTYDTASNSVRFEAAATPPQGATIEIEYDTVCH